MQHKLALEANRVVELEGLLSGMRTSQFKSTFTEQHTADKAGTLEARNLLLTEQVLAFMLFLLQFTERCGHLGSMLPSAHSTGDCIDATSVAAYSTL